MNPRHVARYGAFGANGVSVGRGKVLIDSWGAGTGVVLPIELGRLVSECAVPRTLEEHATHIAHLMRVAGLEQAVQNPSRSLAARARCWAASYLLAQAVEIRGSKADALHARRAVDELVRVGVLLPEAQVLSQLVAAAAPLSGECVAVVGKECRRALGHPIAAMVLLDTPPAGALRGADSVVMHVAERAAAIRVVVMDSSEEPVEQAANRAALHNLGCKYGVAIVHLGAQYRLDLEQALTTACAAPSHVVRFALEGLGGPGRACGAAHNLHLLNSVGSSSLLLGNANGGGPMLYTPPMDKELVLDSALALAEDPVVRSGITVDDHAPARESVLDLHERCLGTSVSECFRSVLEAGGEFVLGELASTFFGDLHSRGSIRVTLGGPSPCRLAGTRLVSNAATWAKLASPAEPRRRQRAVLGNRLICVGEHVGMDHRQPLPPFLPLQSAHGVLWGMVLDACCRGSFRIALPYPGAADGRASPHQWRPSFDTDEIIALLVNAYGTWRPGDAGNDAMRTLGAFLRDTAAQNEADFVSFVQAHCRRSWDLSLSQLEAQLRGATAQARMAIESVATQIERAMLDERELHVGNDRTRMDTWRLLQDVVSRYGELLMYWPDLLNVARELRNLQPWIEDHSLA